MHNCPDLPHMDTQVKGLEPVLYSLAWYPLMPGPLSAEETIMKGHADICLVAGNIDPQGHVRWSTEKTQQANTALVQEAETALCARGLNRGIARLQMRGCPLPLPNMEK